MNLLNIFATGPDTGAELIAPSNVHSDGDFIFVSDWTGFVAAFKVVDGVIVYLMSQAVAGIQTVHWDGTYVACLTYSGKFILYTFSESGFVFFGEWTGGGSLEGCVKTGEVWHCTDYFYGVRSFKIVDGSIVYISGVVVTYPTKIYENSGYLFVSTGSIKEINVFDYDEEGVGTLICKSDTSAGIHSYIASIGNTVIVAAGSYGFHVYHFDSVASTLLYQSTVTIGYVNCVWGTESYFCIFTDTGLFILDSSMNILFSDEPVDIEFYDGWSNQSLLVAYSTDWWHETDWYQLRLYSFGPPPIPPEIIPIEPRQGDIHFDRDVNVDYDLERDAGVETAVYLSLFTNKRKR